MPWANVADNVWLPLRLRGVSRRDARERIAESLALVGLSDFAKAYPRELSGGMRMRVSIARALSVRPRLLLMDEPFAALDEIARFRLNDDLLRLQNELRCTIVFVTHSVYESVYLSSRIAIMSPRPGRIVAEVAARLRVCGRGFPHRPALCRPVRRDLKDPAGTDGGARMKDPLFEASRESRNPLRFLLPLARVRSGACRLGGRRPPARHSALHPAGSEPDRRDHDRRLAAALGLAAHHPRDHACSVSFSQSSAAWGLPSC